MASVPRCVAAMAVSLVANECMALYFSTRFVLLGWAMLCMWVVLDGSLVATSLMHTELALKESVKRNDALHAENMALLAHVERACDNRALLCDIRTRVVGRRHRQPSSLTVLENNPSRAFSASKEIVGLFGFKAEQLQRSLSIISGPLTDTRSFTELQKRGFHGHESEHRFTFYRINGEAVACVVQVRPAVVNDTRAVLLLFKPDTSITEGEGT